MSGWIKMGVGLRRHPKVVRIASALKADRLRVVGALHAVWCVFDEHSNDGQLEGYTPAIMDDEIGWLGFSRAMESIGWLEIRDGSLIVPDYEEHNGPTAKRRALDAQRKGKSRRKADEEPEEEAEFDPQHVRTKRGQQSGQMSASHADKTKNREEKRREEDKTLVAPAEAVPTAAPAPPLKAKDLIAEGVDPQKAADWLALRKAKRLPLTATAWGDTKAEGMKAGMTPPETVAKAVANNWAGFKAAWLLRDATATKAQNGADVFDGVH